MVRCRRQEEGINIIILVICDYFTHWVEAIALPNQEGPTIAKTLVDEWVCRLGPPFAIHSDQGKAFESCLFTEMCHLLGIHKTCTTPYHPQSDALVEHFNRTPQMLLTVHLEQVPENTR